MKIKFSSILIILSVLFFSCKGSVSQDCSGSVTVDSGRVAQYVSQRSPRIVNTARAATVSRSSSYSMDVTYDLIVKLSTQGDYTTTEEIVYSQTVSGNENYSDSDPAGTMYKEDMGKTHTQFLAFLLEVISA